MPISQALYTGVTGLSTNADNMGIIANNIANSNTKGFKYDRGEFEDMLSMDLGGGSSFAQIGRGSRLRNTSSMFSQGGLTGTNGLTDMAIQGDGFFIVKNRAATAADSGGYFYTRQGIFHFDKEGYLVDNNQGRIQGYMADRTGRLRPSLSPVRVIKTNLPPNKTSDLKMIVNLDVRSKAPTEDFDAARPEQTSNFSTSSTVFDSAGSAHEVQMYFKKLEGDENKWQFFAGVDGKDIVGGEDGVFNKFGGGIISFDKDGKLLNEEYEESLVNFKGGVEQEQKISFDFGVNIETEDGDGMGQATSNASVSSVVTHQQDGYETGNLKTLKIDLDGTIKGVFSNGIERQIGAVALASFNNVRGLKKGGMASFYSTVESGPPSLGLAQSGDRGSVYSSSLEESNVDLAQQFVKMIMTQRGFQANSRCITTTDSMIEEVVNLKR